MIAREAKITFIKLSRSGNGGEVFGMAVLLTVRQCIWENKAEQVVLYQQVKVVFGISEGTDTPPHDSPAEGIFTLALTWTSLLKQNNFFLLPATLTLKTPANSFFPPLYHRCKTKLNMS